MKILIACEFTGIVREAFLAKGHKCYSCDIIDSEIPSPFHIKDDVVNVIKDSWDMIIAHPPCTYLCNSGVRWLYGVSKKVDKRWINFDKAVEFFNIFLESHVKKICIENPIQHKLTKELILKPYTQIIHPWQFGHGEQKQTCLWLKNLPLLISTDIVEGREQTIHNMAKSKHRGKDRSRTYLGIAKAMANQWS